MARLEKVFKIIGEQPRAKTCDAIMGIIDEGKEIMDEYKGTRALDAGLLAVAQAVEHYEISRYGTLKTWAEELGFSDAVQLLDATLTEEKNTDKSLDSACKDCCKSKSRSRVIVRLTNVERGPVRPPQGLTGSEAKPVPRCSLTCQCWRMLGFPRALTGNW